MTAASGLVRLFSIPPLAADSTDIRQQDISVVIPVKNNQAGIDRFFLGLDDLTQFYPMEIIVVDNNSDPAIVVPTVGKGIDVQLLKCSKRGPAAARNAGWRAAQGRWIHFVDSDCVPLESTLLGYCRSATRAIGFAGMVHSCGDQAMADYYNAQTTFVPPPFRDTTEICYPQFVITANALIKREALDQIGGFDESFSLAAGEDIDLGIRLWQIGRLEYASRSVVEHTIKGGFVEFCERFYRYGKGNRLIERKHFFPMKPTPFRPVQDTLRFRLLSLVQYLSLRIGYAIIR